MPNLGFSTSIADGFVRIGANLEPLTEAFKEAEKIAAIGFGRLQNVAMGFGRSMISGFGVSLLTGGTAGIGFLLGEGIKKAFEQSDAFASLGMQADYLGYSYSSLDEKMKTWFKDFSALNHLTRTQTADVMKLALQTEKYTRLPVNQFMKQAITLATMGGVPVTEAAADINKLRMGQMVDLSKYGIQMAAGTKPEFGANEVARITEREWPKVEAYQTTATAAKAKNIWQKSFDWITAAGGYAATSVDRAMTNARDQERRRNLKDTAFDSKWNRAVNMGLISEEQHDEVMRSQGYMENQLDQRTRPGELARFANPLVLGQWINKGLTGDESWSGGNIHIPTHSEAWQAYGNLFPSTSELNRWSGVGEEQTSMMMDNPTQSSGRGGGSPFQMIQDLHRSMNNLKKSIDANTKATGNATGSFSGPMG